ncbi:MAG: NAD-dependent epimerase [Micrococcales bacterium]|nr:MAG: NAD-dependent epimerase [Micrococcales bacterium]
MTELHVVVGAGGIGCSTARHLRDLGHEVVVVSRSGTPKPGLPVEKADARDASALAALARGASSIVNAVSPKKYTRWEHDWPPVAGALLSAAEATGAGLVTVSNLYCYGRVDAPMTPETPVRPNGVKGQVRATMWADALQAHQAGRLRATELRASDYFGDGAGKGVSYLNSYVIAPAAAGRTVRLPLGLPDVPHTWTYLDDIGRFAALLATDSRSWGQAWHVPSPPARTIRDVARDVAAVAGRSAPQVQPWPCPAIRAARLFVPIMAELEETRHQFERPFILDDYLSRDTFGVTATDWDEALRRTCDAGTE